MESSEEAGVHHERLVRDVDMRDEVARHMRRRAAEEAAEWPEEQEVAEEVGKQEVEEAEE